MSTYQVRTGSSGKEALIIDNKQSKLYGYTKWGHNGLASMSLSMCAYYLYSNIGACI